MRLSSSGTAWTTHWPSSSRRYGPTLRRSVRRLRRRYGGTSSKWKSSLFPGTRLRQAAGPPTDANLRQNEAAQWGSLILGKIVGEYLHEKPAGERHPRCLGAASPSPTAPPVRSTCSRILRLTVPRTLLPRRGVID